MSDTDAAHPTCQRRRRLMAVAVGFTIALLVVASAAGCAADTQVDPNESSAARDSDPVATAAVEAQPEPSSEAAPAEAAPAEAAPAEAAPAEVDEPADPVQSDTDVQPVPTAHPIAAADTELPKAPIGFDSLVESVSGPQPISIEIEDIGVRSAAIIPVGVNQEDLSFEVPPADQVGWYEFGPAPGESGSSVLAAHIAYNGVDGVFRYLEDVEVGAVIVVGFDDGSSERFRIEEVTEYVKEELPDSLFARDGKEQLALITCGGAFNEQLDSYESNTVAIAVPLDT